MPIDTVLVSPPSSLKEIPEPVLIRILAFTLANQHTRNIERRRRGHFGRQDISETPILSEACRLGRGAFRQVWDLSRLEYGKPVSTVASTARLRTYIPGCASSEAEVHDIL